MPGLEMDPPTPKPPTPNSLKRQLEPKLPAVVIDSLPAQNGLEQAGTKKSPVVELNSEMNEVRFESPEMQLKSKQRPHFDTRLGAEVNKDIPDHAGENEDGDNDIVIGERRASVVSITSDLSDLGPESPQKPASLELSSQPVSSLNLQQTQVQPANAFAAMNGTQEPPRKRAKLSKEEQLDAALKRRVAAAEKAIEKERKDKERAELAAKREAEKAAKEQEKAEKEAEREAEKKRKEAEKDEKRIAREKEAEKREEAKKAKEDEKKRKEEEKRKAEEEKAKKEGKQQKLNAFFMKPASKNASAGSSPTKTAKAASSEKETAKSEEEKRLEEYEKTFPAFFVQNNVTLAPITRAERDAGATQRLENNIDDFLSGRKSLDLPKRFSVTEAFNMPSICFPQRGRAPIPVKSIMASILGATSSKPIDLSIDAYNAQIRSTRNQLKSVKYKFLKFAEDVRPPYVGTYTKEPHCGFKRLARNPMQRELPGVDYDYDSEAEWEPPGEDEEELGSEDEDEEEGDVEDFDGFLDDAEDELTRNRKMGVGVSELEPISSGLCWEDERGQSSRVELHNFRMDILNGKPLLLLQTR